MQLSRRAFLRLAGKAGLAAPFVFGASACAVGTAGRFDADTGLSLGYVTGDVTPDGAVVWLRAEPGSSVSLQYGKDPSLLSYTPLSIRIAGESDYTAKAMLSGLDPATH